eukprot:TRINITY_DN1528_c0_g1_i1.p5 TRINITY_DN1528_c0_g1~~TRINITY_DN1528_c0_g1_i1.p5  ORF type:complete len:108 (-),score=7.51 TRINITY_DN1528_c0_g1_i1:643-966(-)
MFLFSAWTNRAVYTWCGFFMLRIFWVLFLLSRVILKFIFAYLNFLKLWSVFWIGRESKEYILQIFYEKKQGMKQFQFWLDFWLEVFGEKEVFKQLRCSFCEYRVSVR